MVNIKISLITVSRNAVDTIQRCIDSVAMQTYRNLEYIVIDGNSNDGTWELILESKADIHFFKSEPDQGIYDAINKGIWLAKGDVIGVLNADDYFADAQVLGNIAGCFAEGNADVVYADLDYVDSMGSVVRKWRSGKYKYDRFNFGWMPPHPTFYAKRKLFNDLGLYNIDYGSAADYELMLRFMYLNRVTICYLNKVIVKMTVGGVSNRSFNNRLRAWQADFKAMKKHGIKVPLMSVVLKPLRKIGQFF